MLSLRSMRDRCALLQPLPLSTCPIAGPGQGFGSRASKKEVWKILDGVQIYMEPPSAVHELYEKTIAPTFGGLADTLPPSITGSQ